MDNKTAPGQAPDGRRRRSERSRELIIEALIVLVRNGNITVSAAQVAEQAGISIRTVFRHFEEVDQIYRKIIARIESEVMPQVFAAYTSQRWRQRLRELVDRRAEVYEHVLPFKVAASVRRYRSQPLLEDHRRFVAVERETLEAILPASVTGDETLLAALDTALSFEAWRRLRHDVGLDREQAWKAMQLTAEKLTR